MTASLTALIGADVHDGTLLHRGKAMLLDGDVVRGFVYPDDLPVGCERKHLDGGTLLPGFVDLQVNGGGGVMFNDDQSVAALKTIAKAHASLGTAALLPTLITDTSERTIAAIDAVEQAIAQNIPGIVGIHLEGPHLSIARKGAHDPSLIRPINDTDMNAICAASRRLLNVMLTLAPENATPEQISELTNSGVIVSLGHSDATYDRACVAFDNGATCTTHLFNAMSQIGNREPGLVGAALDDGRVSAGLIADEIHVHPVSMRIALAAKQGPGQIFLVTDAMSTAGSDITEFDLNGRRILRANGRLTLADGTLAGADLDMATAVGVMTAKVGVSKQTAIAMATSIPASILRSSLGYGNLTVGAASKVIYLDKSLKLAQTSFT